MRHTQYLTIPLALLIASPVLGQATTVQLPTQQIFSVGTTVSVPDRGAISLGDVSRARESSVERGIGAFRPFKNKGIGRELSKSGLQARVWIMDLDEMDKEVLARARQQRASGGQPVSAGGASLEEQQLALYLTRHMGRTTAPASRRDATSFAQGR